MEKEAAQELYRASVRTFEGLAFLLAAEEGDAEDQAAAPLQGVVCVDFEGPFSGCLVVRYFGELAEAVAANMMGAATPVRMEMGMDALKEVTNVICGNFLPAIAGDEAVFRLAAPRVVVDGYQPDPGCYALAAQAQVALEGGRVQVAYFRRQARSAEVTPRVP